MELIFWGKRALPSADTLWWPHLRGEYTVNADPNRSYHEQLMAIDWPLIA